MSHPLDSLLPALQAAPFDAVMDLWTLIEQEQGDAGKAWLGRNDRYYLLTRLLHRVDAVHPWLFARCREVEAAPDGHLDLWAREHYKGEMLNTPIPTPSGWTLFGDLKIGDSIFGADGMPCTVIAHTPIFHDPHCYEVVFDDGITAQVSSAHLWTVEKRSVKRIPGAHKTGYGKRYYREKTTLATSEIFKHDHRPDNRLSVQINEPLVLPDANLPIDPYVLGAWLGDGHADRACITMLADDAQPLLRALESAGHRWDAAKTGSRALSFRIDMRDDSVCIRGHARTPENLYRSACRLCKAQQQRSAIYGDAMDPVVLNGLSQRLDAMGLLGRPSGVGRGHCKHIPMLYLRASIEQRMALLRGLMDTDGHCDTRGKATFVNVSDRLADDVYELAHSLGLNPHKHHYKNGGRGYWQVSFPAYQESNPFLIPRKAARAKPGKRPNPRRYIVAVREIETVPMRCIQVDRDDGLYLTGRSMLVTHNSTIITFSGIIQELLRDPEITIGIFSHTKPVARKFMLQIKQELEQNRELQGIYPDVLYADPRNESSKWSEEKGLVVRRLTNPKEASVEAHGLVDGQPTGAHFVLRVYDDVVTRESVSTSDQVAKTTSAWELSDNLGAANANGPARAWMPGTRYSFQDSYQSIIDRGALKVRVYPATDNGMPDGKPVFLTEAAWADKKLKQGPATIACQMLQNPAAGNEAMFKKEWLSFIDIRPATLNVYIMVDPAHSKKKGSDNTAMAVVGIDASGNKYLLDGYRHKMGLRERWQAMSGLRKVWTAQPGVQMVKVGYERYGMQADLEYFEEQMLATKDAFEIYELNWVSEGGQSKDDRVQRLQPDFQSRKFYLAAVTEGESANQKRIKSQGQGFRIFSPVKRRDHEGHVYSLNKGFLEEYLTYPFSAKKDLIDACSRLYDMSPVTPIIVDERMLEPETFAD